MTLDLFDQPDAIKARWLEFHEEHPEVYDHLVSLARARRRAGYGRGSIKQLWEILRWDIEVGTVGTDPDDYAFNNNYTALYAREIMRCEPDLRGFFETRRRQTA